MAQRLKDIIHLRREASDSDHLLAVQQKLQHQMLQATMRWTRLRNRMLVDCLRPTWVDKEVLEARPLLDALKLRPEVPETEPAQPPGGQSQVTEV